jgi:3-dehydroshikimate dehydratase
MVYPGLVSHANLLTGWQPHTGRPTDECAAGQRDVLAHLGSIHEFHWWPTSAERHPLLDGAERWSRFWPLIRQAQGDRFTLLEVVCGETPEQFPRDAATLRQWLVRFGGGAGCASTSEGADFFLRT